MLASFTFTVFTRKRRPVRFLVPLFVVVLVASACSSGDASSVTSASSVESSSDTADAPTDDSTTTAADAADPVAAAEAQVQAIRDAFNELDGGVKIAAQAWPTDWTKTTIDTSSLRAGLRSNDTRDGIPPLDDPDFQTVEEAAEWVQPQEPGALVRIDDEAWFFPLSIMTAHEIVNHTLAGVPVAVTFCPLCNTAVAFDRRVGDDVLRFGVSGLLRNSDLVMWDDATTSLWQQITGEAIVGEFAGTELTPISTSIVSFEQFSEGFPDGLSLSPNNRFGREYGRNPYVGYSSEQGPIGAFFTQEVDERLPALSRVVGVRITETAQAYPFDVLSVERAINDTIDDIPIVILWGGTTTDALDGSTIADSATIGSAVAYDARIDGQTLTFTPDGDAFIDDQTGSTWNILGQAVDGELTGSSLDTVTHRNEFWFAFAGFFPESTIYSS